MNFSTAVKMIQMNLLQQAGINVTPKQLGLKPNVLRNPQNPAFSAMMGNATMGGLTVPTAPTPPADPLDATAQSKYQSELLAYQNNMQAYNQRFMQLMLTQFQALQQSMLNLQRTPGSTSATSGSATGITSVSSGVGGILDG